MSFVQFFRDFEILIEVFYMYSGNIGDGEGVVAYIFIEGVVWDVVRVDNIVIDHLYAVVIREIYREN